MHDGQTDEESIDEQLRVHERAKWVALETTSYAEIPEDTPDEWGSLAEQVSLLSVGAIASLPDDDWTCPNPSPT